MANTTSASRTISDDVYLLAGLLGRVLRRQEGEAAFERVERVRLLAKEYRNGDRAAGTELEAIVAGCSAAEAASLVRAFTHYFQLINLAEDNERVRRIRRREAADPGPRRGSVREAVGMAADSGLDADGMQRLLNRAMLRPVLTAHPTEARRRTVIAKLARVFDVIRDLDERRVLPSEVNDARRRLEATATELWDSNEIRSVTPTVLDEVRANLVYVTSTLVDVIPAIYRDLEQAVADVYPDAGIVVPPFLTLGSWVGGDRDGNPNVTPEVTAETLVVMRDAALADLDARLLDLAGRTSVSTWMTGPAPMLDPLLAENRERFPELGALLARVNAEEPYRQALSLIRERVRAARSGSPGGYAVSAELLADLRLVDVSLRSQRGETIASGDLHDTIRRVEVFGFHFAKLDLRDHANRHAAALRDIFAATEVEPDYLALDQRAQCNLLARELASPRPLVPVDLAGLRPETREVVETFRMVRRLMDEGHAEALGTYIVSGFERPSDALGVLLLMQEAGLCDRGGANARLQVVPLFEQDQGLRDAPDTMRSLLAEPAYRAALRSWGDAQEVMIGYSDSNKELGYLGSSRALDTAQRELTAVFDDAGIDHTFFHGRGGSIGRGGGPSNEAILALPPGTVDGRVKLTEQGEVIASRYSTAAIAHRELELVTGAVLVSSVGALPEPEPAALANFHAAFDVIADASVAHYQSLVYGDPEFVRFFEQATPIREIARLQLGSRPARRVASTKIEDLRAIPWVFAWTQARILLPGWYGLGTGLAAGEASHGIDLLREMFRRWPLFRTTLANAELALAKADMAIAERYVALVGSVSLAERVWTAIRDEHARSVETLLRVTEQQRLLDREPMLQRSIDRRNPYVDPLSFVQVDLLRRLRRQPDDPELLRTVLLTVNGIAGGLKNTG